jgi:IS30 family transposase
MSKTQRRISAQERETISRGLACGFSGAEISRQLGRNASVVNREISRHGGRKAYRATNAQRSANRCPARAALNKVADHPGLMAEVLTLFETGATPKQIEMALWLKYPDNPENRVSHETIYDYIYVHAKGQLRKDLISFLRRKKPRRSPAPKARSKLSGQLPGAVKIGDRPTEVALREAPGHWEADLIMGAGNRTAILVITERATRFVMIMPLRNKDAASVCRALIRAFKDVPVHMRKTLTYDNGREMAEHLSFTMATKMQVYFCDPHSPWQRGSVENINGLIREYFPKGTDFTQVTKSQIAKVEWRLNHRPREVLGGMTPNAAFTNLIHSFCALAG